MKTTELKKELRQYILLKREIEKTELRLGEEDNSDMREMLENNKLRCTALLMKTQQFIFSIEDSGMRQIFEARYIKGLDWAGVAVYMGGYYSKDYLRITHDRYLQKRMK